MKSSLWVLVLTVLISVLTQVRDSLMNELTTTDREATSRELDTFRGKWNG